MTTPTSSAAPTPGALGRCALHRLGLSIPSRSAGRPSAPLALRIVREGTRILLVLLVAAAFVVPIVAFVAQLAAVTILLVLISIPVASVPVRTALVSTVAPELVRALKRMAITQLAYALLFTLGILL